MQTVDVGETWDLFSQWWDDELQGVEPSAIELTIELPDGSTLTKAKADMTGSASTAEPTLDTWTYPVLTSMEGLWRYSFTADIGDSITQGGVFLVGAHNDASPGPCEPWCDWEDVLRTCPTVDLSSLDTGARDQLIDSATWLLYALDGSRYPGLCEATRRLCRGCRVCRREVCGCGARDQLDLGGRWPVWAVWDVMVDGEAIPSSAYELRDRRWLVRIDGERWPSGSDLDDPDEFTATWAYGRRPPIGLRIAAARLVAEMAKSCLGLKCELPQRVTSLTREQVSYVILDPQKFLDQGRTGVYAVDLALIAAQAARKGGPGGFSPYARPTHASRVG